MRLPSILIGVGLVLGAPTSVQAADAAVKCASDKIKEAGKYSFCRLKVDSKAIRSGEAPDYSKCDSKYSEKWQKIEAKGAGACPSSGDEAAIQAQVQQCVDDVVADLKCLAGAVEAGGACWLLGNFGDSCDTVCANVGLVYDTATQTYAGSGGTLAQCEAVLDALEATAPNCGEGDCGATPGVGCGVIEIIPPACRFRCTAPVTDSSSGDIVSRRACACR